MKISIYVVFNQNNISFGEKKINSFLWEESRLSFTGQRTTMSFLITD